MKKSILPIAFVLSLLATSTTSLALELHPQLGHTNRITSVAYSPDGLHFVSASDDKTAKLWEVSSGKELRTFTGHGENINSIAYSPDGKYIATGSNDKTVKVWDVSTGKQLQTLTHKSWVTSVSYSSSGRYLATASNSVYSDHIVTIWETSTGKQLRSIPYKEEVGAVTFSPDGIDVAVASDKIRLWEAKTGREVITIESSVRRVVYSADAKYLASISYDDTARLWETSSGKELRTFKGHTNTINAIAFSPNGLYIATGSSDETIRLWEVSTGKELRLIGNRDEVWSVAFSPDSASLLCSVGNSLTDYKNYELRVWDVKSGKEIRAFRAHTKAIRAVTFSPDGRYLASASADSTVRLWDVKSAKEIRAFRGHAGEVKSIAFSPDSLLLASASADSTVRLWDVKSAKEVRTFKGHAGIVYSVAYSPDGKYLASGGHDDTVRLWEVKTGKELHSFLGHTSLITSVVFSPDGELIASSSWDQTVKLWSVKAKGELATLEGHTDVVNSVAFSPNGELLASSGGYYDKTIRLWDLTSNEELRSLKGHNNNVWAVAFSPDGLQLASSSGSLFDIDQTVKLWDIKGGKELRSLEGHTGEVQSVAFSPDGELIASGSKDGTMRLWREDSAASAVMVSNEEGDWLLYNDDGLFDSSPGGVELVAAVEGMNGYNISQLALKNNRPDLLLKQMGLGSPEVIEYYYKRYLNRLKKAKLEDETKIDGAFRDLPKSAITETKISASGQEAEASLTLEDKVGLKSYQVYVNGAALYEGFGKETSGTKQRLKEKILLTEGENRVEVSALNIRGQESFRSLAVLAGPASLKKDLYFVGFGVSDYADPDIPDLQFANKDAKDLSAAFDKLQGYEHRLLKTYTNEQVTKESIQEAKALFKKAKPQDTVVLFIAGHGIHDRDGLATYYYIIHDTQLEIDADGDVKLEAATAVSFDEIEELLSGIDAKQKLFLMDTCESGEREDADATRAVAGAKAQKMKARAIGVSKVVAAKKAPKKVGASAKSSARPWLLERERYIYQDLAQRTGAIVFSSSKGGEFSYESKKLENGLFTEALLEGLSKKADENKDNNISTDELRKYVSQRVVTLSANLQHPTVDRDNLSLRLSFAP